MIALGIDTSTILGGVALARGDRLLGETRCDARAAASERLLPQIDRLLDDLGLARSDCDRIGVTLGPGSFTGVRVGLATAKGLALGLDVPLVPVSSLEARIRRLAPAGRAVLVVSAPRQGELFAAAGCLEGDGFRWLQAPAARSLAAAPFWLGEALRAAREVARLPLLCAGDGLPALLAALGEARPALEGDGLLPLAGILGTAVPGIVARIAATAPEAQLVRDRDLDALMPAYLRGSYARPPRARDRGARA